MKDYNLNKLQNMKQSKDRVKEEESERKDIIH